MWSGYETRKVAIFSCLTGQVISVRNHRTIKYRRVEKRKEDLSSVGDYYLNCGEVNFGQFLKYACSFKERRGLLSLRGRPQTSAATAPGIVFSSATFRFHA